MPAMRKCPGPNGCPNLTRGGRCPTCQAEADVKRRPNGNPYNTPGHRAFRAQVLARDPYCLCRGECGHHVGQCGRVATVADHDPVERRDLVSAGLDPNAPEYGRGKCAACHDRRTARTSPGGWHERE